MYDFEKEIQRIDSLRSMGYDLYFISHGSETTVEFSKENSSDVLFSITGELCSCINSGYERIKKEFLQ